MRTKLIEASIDSADGIFPPKRDHPKSKIVSEMCVLIAFTSRAYHQPLTVNFFVAIIYIYANVTPRYKFEFPSRQLRD